MKVEQAISDIPVVVLNAQTTSEDYDDAYSAGCSAFIKKSVDMESLVSKVEEILIT